ncbi:hypothetical protein BU26DRAFT_500867 [Trematosphaeria pertusa]|uniref:Uncharacterized protein n=1 Tax=Trematosphaeria pertusa TaxID=390896 RepID=A0A6A6IXZ9_9PLEO|nr:uncharacterized protein BU26DRAFT_500867 [Trematosphaeria pertusa]KAF2255274.1 hypothetical protein BU26DRAFT_500867 [Trematosphaeria pertusa]
MARPVPEELERKQQGHEPAQAVGDAAFGMINRNIGSVSAETANVVRASGSAQVGRTFPGVVNNAGATTRLDGTVGTRSGSANFNSNNSGGAATHTGDTASAFSGVYGSRPSQDTLSIHTTAHNIASIGNPNPNVSSRPSARAGDAGQAARSAPGNNRRTSTGGQGQAQPTPQDIIILSSDNGGSEAADSDDGTDENVFKTPYPKVSGPSQADKQTPSSSSRWPTSSAHSGGPVSSYASTSAPAPVGAPSRAPESSGLAPTSNPAGASDSTQTSTSMGWPSPGQTFFLVEEGMPGQPTPKSKPANLEDGANKRKQDDRTSPLTVPERFHPDPFARAGLASRGRGHAGASRPAPHARSVSDSSILGSGAPLQAEIDSINAGWQALREAERRRGSSGTSAQTEAQRPAEPEWPAITGGIIDPYDILRAELARKEAEKEAAREAAQRLPPRGTFSLPAPLPLRQVSDQRSASASRLSSSSTQQVDASPARGRLDPRALVQTDLETRQARSQAARAAGRQPPSRGTFSQTGALRKPPPAVPAQRSVSASRLMSYSGQQTVIAPTNTPQDAPQSLPSSSAVSALHQGMTASQATLMMHLRSLFTTTNGRQPDDTELAWARIQLRGGHLSTWFNNPEVEAQWIQRVNEEFPLTDVRQPARGRPMTQAGQGAVQGGHQARARAASVPSQPQPGLANTPQSGVSQQSAHVQRAVPGTVYGASASQPQRLLASMAQSGISQQHAHVQQTLPGTVYGASTSGQTAAYRPQESNAATNINPTAGDPSNNQVRSAYNPLRAYYGNRYPTARSALGASIGSWIARLQREVQAARVQEQPLPQNGLSQNVGYGRFPSPAALPNPAQQQLQQASRSQQANSSVDPVHQPTGYTVQAFGNQSGLANQQPASFRSSSEDYVPQWLLRACVAGFHDRIQDLQRKEQELKDKHDKETQQLNDKISELEGKVTTAYRELRERQERELQQLRDQARSEIEAAADGEERVKEEDNDGENGGWKGADDNDKDDMDVAGSM